MSVYGLTRTWQLYLRTFVVHEAALRHHVIMFDPGRYRSRRFTETLFY
jgi:hypothetical protein